MNPIQGAKIGTLTPPTIKISQNSGQMSKVAPNADDYFSLTIDTRGVGGPTQVILFDASGGYQYSSGNIMDPGVIVQGMQTPYSFILNDTSHNAFYFNIIRMKVRNFDDNGNCIPGCGDFDKQLDHRIQVFNTTKGKGTMLVDSIFPDKGIHEGQFQVGLVTFRSEHIIDNRMALVYTQEANREVSLSFYVKAELGLKQ